MTEFLIGELRKAVRSSDRKPLIVCGAGVSTQATNGKAPSWANLIRSGIQHVENVDANAGSWASEARQKLENGGTDTWIAVADEVTDRLGGGENREFADWLENEVSKLEPERRDLLDLILALRCPIATTNYDDVLTRAAGLRPIDWSDHVGTLRFLREGTADGILHLHGHWRNPETVVLGSKSYAEHSADNRRQLLQEMATLDRETVFIGCSQEGLADPDFSRLDSFLAEWWQRVAPRRYWLVRQERGAAGQPQPPPSPILPRRLFPIGFGTEFDDLLRLLETLPEPVATRAFDANAAIRCIDQHEPRPVLFGRDGEIALVVDAVLAGRSVVIAGGPGMGKTAVATAALYDPSVVDRFGRRRVFASLETVTEPRAALAKLVEALGLPPTGDEVSLLRILETSAAERPLAAILDNAETIFDIDRPESERLLNLLTQIKDLSLVVTLRGVAPRVPGAASIDDIPRLPTPAARDAFVAAAGAEFQADPDLPYLLEALDGHALSINLVAAQANGLPVLRGLRELLEKAHADILRRPGEQESRLTSVRASLALSLDSRRMRSAPLARRLVGLLALLPGGLAEADVPALLGERAAVSKAKSNEAIVCLHQLRLVERRPDARLRMLTPLRECARRDVPVFPADRQRLIERYHAIAANAGKIGRNEWDRVRDEVETEVDNLDPICSFAVESGTWNRNIHAALMGLGEFHRFSARASVNSLARAIERRIGDVQGEANCIRSLGSIALQRSDNETASARFDAALALYRRVGSVQGEANCIQSLGTIALQRSDHETASARFDAALALYRRVGDVQGEANCIQSLGDIALQRSDHKTASARFDAALALYRRVGDVQGEANCIQGLGNIALQRSDHETASARFDAALALYRRVGSVQGEANCIQSLGNIALQRSDHETASARFDAALALYRRIGSVLGEANCIQSLGDIALQRSDHETASARFDAALALYRRIGDVHGEANCIRSLGDIALRRSDHETASARFDAALALYRRIGSVQGEANCIQSLGNIALQRSDHETASARFDAALALYRRIGSVQGEANCIRSLGDIALRRSDHETASARFDAALALYRRIGDVQGEANCIMRLGAIALRRSDHEAASARFEAALALYRNSDNQYGIAETMIRLGQAQCAAGEVQAGLDNIQAGFALYFSKAVAKDRALAGWQALHHALVCGDAAEAASHRGQARQAWTAIGRLDLIHDWLDAVG